MPQWGPFLVTVAVLTVLVLILARASASAIHEGELVGPDDRSRETIETGPVSTDDGRTDKKLPDGTVAEVESVEMDHDFLEATSSNDETAVTKGDPAREECSAAKGQPTVGKRTEDPSQIRLTTELLLANVAFTQGLVVVVILIAAWYFAIPTTAFGITADPMGAGLVGVGVGLAFGVVLWIGNELSTTIADVVGAAYDETVREMLAPDTPAGWAVLLGVVLPLIALSEELLFRAALIGVPAAGYGLNPWLLAIVSSAAFALGHGAQGRVGVVVTGALGFVLAGGYILTGSLLVVVIAHYVINAMEFVVHEYYM